MDADQKTALTPSDAIQNHTPTGTIISHSNGAIIAHVQFVIESF